MSAIGTIALLATGYAAGAFTMGAAVLAGQRLKQMQPPPTIGPQFASWIDRREERDDELRAKNAEMVAANRRASDANNPNGIRVVRDEYDAEEANNGRTW